MEKIFDIAKDSEQSWGTLATTIDRNFDEASTGIQTAAQKDELDQVRSDLSVTTDKLTKLEMEMINISDIVTSSVVTEVGKQYNNYIYATFKAGDKIKITIESTEDVLQSNAKINIRNDKNETLVFLTFSNNVAYLVLSDDTAFIRAYIAAPVKTDNVTMTIHKGDYIRIESLEKVVSENNNDITYSLLNSFSINGYYVRVTDGVLIESPSYQCTPYLPYSQNVKIHSKVGGLASKITFYDANFGYLGSLNDVSDEFDFNNIGSSLPEGTAYFRCSNSITLNPSPYIKMRIESALGNLVEIVADIKEISANGWKQGYKFELPCTIHAYITSEGKLFKSDYSKCTGYIPVNGLKSFFVPKNMLTGSMAINVYDSNKRVIQSFDSANNNSVVTLNENASYIIFSFSDTVNYIVAEEVTNKVIENYGNFTLAENLLYKAGINILSSSAFTKGGFIRKDGSLYNHESWYYSDYIRVEPGVYNYKDITSRAADNGAIPIIAFDKARRVVEYFGVDGTTEGTITLSNKVYYIRFSTTNLWEKFVPANDVFEVVNKCISPINIDVNNSHLVKKNGNVIKVNGNEWNDSDMHLTFEFKANGYAEGKDSITIAKVGDANINLYGRGNQELVIPSLAGDTHYPVPQRLLCYGIEYYDSILNTTPKLSLPYYREFIGDDMFSLRYVGAAREHNYDIDNPSVQSEYARLYNRMHLSFVDGILVVSDETQEFMRIDTSLYPTIGSLVDYINDNYPLFKADLLCNYSDLVSSLAPITKVCLVSVYFKVHVELSEHRYDAFPCYFNNKIDDGIHSCEVLVKDRRLYVVVDGLPITNKIEATYITDIELGSNDIDCPIEICDYHICIGSCEDAEPLDDGRIVSNFNPSVVCLMGHGMYFGDECDGKKPIYVGQIPASDQAAVIPESYRKDILSLNEIAMSDKRFDRLAKYAKSKGYEYLDINEFKHINDGKMPKRCWAITFDDKQQYFFQDLKLRQVFAKHGICPSLSVEFWLDDVSDEEKVALMQRINRAGWQTPMHGMSGKERYIQNVCAMTSTELYNITTHDTTELNAFNVQREQAEKYGIDWTTWVYTNGSANPNTIKAFEHLGVACGMMTSIGVNNCRGTNKYYICRPNASDKIEFSKLEKLFV